MQAQITWKISPFLCGNKKYLSIDSSSLISEYYLQFFQKISFTITIQKIFHFKAAKYFTASFEYAAFTIFFKPFRILN